MMMAGIIGMIVAGILGMTRYFLKNPTTVVNDIAAGSTIVSDVAQDVNTVESTMKDKST